MNWWLVGIFLFLIAYGLFMLAFCRIAAKASEFQSQLMQKMIEEINGQKAQKL